MDGYHELSSQGGDGSPELCLPIDDATAGDFPWRQCGLIPRPAIDRCAILFTSGLADSVRIRAGKPSVPTVGSLQCFVEALVLSERVAFTVPLGGNQSIPDFVESTTNWLGPASAHARFVGLRGPAFAAEGRQVAALLQRLGPASLRDRAQLYQGEAVTLSAGLAAVRLSDSDGPPLHVIASDDGRIWLEFCERRASGNGSIDITRASEIAAMIEMFELAIARSMCDERQMMLWAVPSSTDLHVLSLAHHTLTRHALRILRQEVAAMREGLLGPDPAYLGLAGPDIHCMVGLTPVFLAALREARSAPDLITVSLQLRDAARPFREHLAGLEECSGDAMLRLADWHRELQAVSRAVGRAIGLPTPADPGNLGTAVFRCLRGDPAALVEAVLARVPPRVARALQHPAYLARRTTFLRDLLYNAILAPEVDSKLARLFS